MDRKIRYLLILSFLSIFATANAQFDDPKTLEVGPHVGMSYYMGDLNPMLPFAQAQLQYGGLVRFNYNNRWTFRFDYSRVKVTAYDEVVKWRPERGLNFTSNINDFSLVAEFNFLEYYTGNPKKNVSPYIFGGISVFQYTAYAEVAGTMVDLSDHATEGPEPSDAKWYDKMFGKTSPIGVSIPFGMGVKFSLSRHMGATIEWRMQKTFTDYLDDVATVYPKEHASVEIDGTVYDLTDPTGNYHAGQQRGNSSFNDWFGMARASLTWKFNLPDGRGCNLSKF
ncbi:MAG: hypothetical protein IJ057_00680 [Bacteroidales bacterium]|nr:hypothetical protein [Bacteroidales bacterium]